MKNLSFLCLSSFLIFSAPVLAEEASHASHPSMSHPPSQTTHTPPGGDQAGTHPAQDEQQQFRLSLTADNKPQIGKPLSVTARLMDTETGSLLGEADLKVAHTRKLHLLVIDQSLTDYHHIHPDYDGKGGWIFSFTPLKGGQYRVWADIVSTRSGQQSYVRADIGTPDATADNINKSTNTTTQSGPYSFKLDFEQKPQAGSHTPATLTVIKNGKSYDGLEPVMGAYAHLVGFNDDRQSVLHIHPLGKEPSSETERGKGAQKFMIAFQKSGFVKFFAQVKIDGQEVFAPFGVSVDP